MATFGRGAQGFALDPACGVFLSVTDTVGDPSGGKKTFSCNVGNSLHWDAPLVKYVDDCTDTARAKHGSRKLQL